MRILFDTDIMLDVVLERQPFLKAAAALWKRHNDGEIEGVVAAITLVNVFYIARKSKGIEGAREAVRTILTTFEICVVNEADLRAALSSPISDYEDAVQHECALAAGADAIVTRNLADFQNSSLPIWSPPDLENHLATQN